MVVIMKAGIGSTRNIRSCTVSSQLCHGPVGDILDVYINYMNYFNIKCLICASHCSGDIMVNGLEKILLSWKRWRVVCLKITQSGWLGG